MLKAILIHTIFCRYPIKCFSKQHITHESDFFLLFSFMMHDSDRSLISDGLSFIWSSCSQASSWIWQRENKSWNFIGYSPRKVYWKILHSRLWRISTNALTHVLRKLLDFSFQLNYQRIRTIEKKWLFLAILWGGGQYFTKLHWPLCNPSSSSSWNEDDRIHL